MAFLEENHKKKSKEEEALSQLNDDGLENLNPADVTDGLGDIAAPEDDRGEI